MILPSVLEYDRYGVKDRCLDFDGTDDYVDCNFTSVDTSQPFTYELWFKRRTSAVRYLLAQAFAGTPREPVIEIASDFIRVRLRQTNGTNIVLSGDIDNDIWNHVAAVYNGTTLFLYVNGVMVDSVGAVSPNINNVNLFIGRRLNADYYNGLIDEVRIWNHARTADQIKRYMNVRLRGTETGLVAYYNMNLGSGSTLHDNSVNSNNGTIVGATWVTP